MISCAIVSQCDLFIQEGARLGRTPAEVVSMCDITFSCVSDPKAARDVSESISNCKNASHLSFVVKSAGFFGVFFSWCWDPVVCCKELDQENATWKCLLLTRRQSQNSHRYTATPPGTFKNVSEYNSR